MSFGGFERGSAPAQPMAEINVTPLVDVMLVLLVIFIITAPLLTHAVKLDLPAEHTAAASTAAAAVQLSIDATGTIYWDAEVVDDTALRERLAVAAQRTPQPELHLRADRATRYEPLAHVMALAQQAGIARLGFVTEPAEPSAAGAVRRSDAR